MSAVRTFLAVTTMGLQSMPKRPGSSIVLVIGMAGVVAVLICALALAEGFVDAAARAGRADRAIVLSRGALSEAASRLSRANAIRVLDRPEIASGTEAKPIGSAENLLSVRFTDKRTGLDTFATLRGVGPMAAAMRPEVRIVAGRMFTPGVREIVVGRALQRRLQSLSIGDQIKAARGNEWTVVGVFESGEDARESEMLTDVETLLAAFARKDFNSVTAQLTSSASFDSFRSALANDPTLAVDVRRESEYFAETTQERGQLLRFVAYAIGGIMAFGAMAAAVNALYSAIEARTVEIATLRAIGFSGSSVVFSVFAEALLLTFAGAAIGAAIAWTFFNGNSISLLGGNSPTPMTYSLRITADLISLGVGSACLVGMIGGSVAALRATTLPIAAVINGR